MKDFMNYINSNYSVPNPWSEKQRPAYEKAKKEFIQYKSFQIKREQIKSSNV